MRSLLMGGQACVLYGGAEFSRDTDLAVLGDSANLQRLSRALDELSAERIAVPPFEARYLDMGLAVHFRCNHPDVLDMRIDVMTKMRGVDEFPLLWERRSTFETAGGPVESLALPDLVAAKKTQREKDWPMIARLVEVSYLTASDAPTPSQIQFWLLEMRTPRQLVAAAKRFPAEANDVSKQRPAVEAAVGGNIEVVASLMHEEQRQEREADAAYWNPLRKELERLRHERA